MTNPTPLRHGRVYHIYNRGVNRENIFLEKRNYLHFLKLYAQHITPIAYTYAYCLLRNHFHLMVQVKTPEEIRDGENLTGFENLSGLGETRDQNLTGLEELSGLAGKPPSQVFSNFFNAYAKAINKEYGRAGSLFQRPFGRIEVASDRYFMRLVTYIHHNPVKHNFVTDFRAWPYSSYRAIAATQPTRLERKVVLDWFDGRQGFADAHSQYQADNDIGWLIGNDVD